MRRLTFTSADRAALRHDRSHHPHPRVQPKLAVLWLKSQGCTPENSARLAAVSRRSGQRYLDEFADGGLARLRRWPGKGKPQELAAHQASLEDSFVEHPPRSARAAQAAIAAQTGRHRGLPQVRCFFKKRSAGAGGQSAPSRPKRTPTSKPTS